jgi:hypothetical protein
VLECQPRWVCSLAPNAELSQAALAAVSRIRAEILQARRYLLSCFGNSQRRSRAWAAIRFRLKAGLQTESRINAELRTHSPQCRQDIFLRDVAYQLDAPNPHRENETQLAAFSFLVAAHCVQQLRSVNLAGDVQGQAERFQ